MIAWTDFTGDAREAFRETVGLDADAWRRASGWALWKALITLADPRADARKVALSLDVLAQVMGG